MFIKIFTTGGTIDKIYFDAKNDYHVGEPEINRVLDEAIVNFDYGVESILKKDSLDMNENDREVIKEHVLKEKSKHIVITHGTDSMVETAKVLKSIKDKTIVLTGSMQPARIRESDAVYNIGAATTAVQLLKPGVYIAMNGQIFRPASVKKNVQKNRFEEI